MNRGLVLAVAAGLTVALLCLSWSAHRAGRPTQAAHRTGTRWRFPALTAASPPEPAVDAGRLLPFTPEQITRAAQLAQTFIAAYSTHRYHEPGAAYLQHLAPMTAPSLYAVLERATADPTVQVPRQRMQEVTLTHAHTEMIRELGPTSITFIVTATEHVTTTYATRRDTARYAVTLIPATGGGWTVYDVELAAAGQGGDHGGRP